MMAPVAMAILIAAGQQPQPFTCTGPVSIDASGGEVCLGQAEIRLADAAPKASRDRHQHLDQAVAHYRRAVTLTTNPEDKARALSALVDLYDTERLSDLVQMELMVRELRRVVPNDVAPMFKLAKSQEDQ